MDISALRAAFRYEERTGRLFWRISPSQSVRAGDAAGSDNGQGYMTVKYKGKKYALHRLVWALWYGEFPNQDIDHINGHRSDNRIANLRAVTNQQNCQNRRKPTKKNKSGFLGVAQEGSRWRAQICVDNRRIRLGYFDSPQQAHEAYMRAKRRLHPGFAEV